MKQVSFIILLSLAIQTVIFNNTFCQWVRTNGPTGAAVSDIERSGSSLAIVTVYGETYFSSDLGNSWTERTGLPLSFAPRLTSADGKFYAATESGVFVTANNGANWNNISQGMGNIYVRGITVKDGFLYAVSDEVGSDKIYRFNEATQSWKNVGSITTTFQFSVYNLFSYNNNLYVSYSSNIFPESQVVFRSSDNGVTWQDMSSGLPQGAFQFASYQDKIFVSTVNGVYKSENSGMTWNPSGLTNTLVYSLTISGDTLYAGSSGDGVFRSTDLGGSWQSFGIQDKWIFDMSVLNEYLFAGTNFVGMYRTAVNESNWMLINNGINGIPVNSFAQTNNSIIAGAFGGLFISTDMGLSWQDKGKNFQENINGGSLGGSHLVYDVATDTISNIIYAGSLGAIYRSANNGDNWDLLGQTSLGNGRIEAMEVSYLNSNQRKLFAGKGTGDQFTGLHSSTDQGLSWSLQNFGLQFPYILDVEKKDNLIFASGGFSQNGGIRRSSDNGITWQLVNSGLPAETAVEYVFNTNNGFLLAATDNGVYRSSNNGDSWFFVWDNENVKGFAADRNGIIYAGSEGSTYRGIHKSTDNGASWQPFNEGFSRLPNIVFSITYKNGFIFAGVDRLGIWKRQVDNTTGTAENNQRIPESFSLEQNFPNPFNPVTTIKFSLSGKNFVSLKVYDILGKEIAELVNEIKTAGIHEVRFNADQYSSGIYLYKLTAGNFVDTKQMILLK